MGTEHKEKRRILITGCSGFVGSWLCRALVRSGAGVSGYGLAPPTEPSLFALGRIEEAIHYIPGDIRDGEAVQACLEETRPQIVIHLAAQSIVGEGYRDPVLTYDTNVMGTVHLLEAIRRTDSVRAIVNMTSDKVYHNLEDETAFEECDRLDGNDPYANSKSCSDLATAAYWRGYLKDQGCGVITLRAGNLIGGGDFAKDRIIPDVMRGLMQGEVIRLRKPGSRRPYQHVMEAVSACRMAGERLLEEPEASGAYNIGPDESMTTGELVRMLCHLWKEKTGEEARIEEDTFGEGEAFAEADVLRIDSSKAGRKLGWQPRWSVKTALKEVVDFMISLRERKDVKDHLDRWIGDYQGEACETGK